MAVIIALNLYVVTTNLSFDFYLDNYANSQITNERFVIAGYFRKREDILDY
jgi:hypothetical protein